VSEAERHREIIRVLASRPFATVRELIDVLSVSPATVRRDIEKLHEAGEARKVFGGVASLEAQRGHALTFDQSSDLAVEAKRAIAREAASLCRDGDMVMIGGGSTCFQVGLLLADRALAIHTHSMPLAAALSVGGGCQLSLAGGTLHREPGIVHDAAGDPPEFFASRLFLGAQGIGPRGLQESHPLLPAAIGRLLARTDEVVVVADHRKFGVSARHVACPIGRIATVITDDGARAADIRALEDEGVAVIVAERGRGA
jgi:DeoR family transcriptional regulator, ulaG and ulaABCDEF operon transcriptional repressor